MPKTERMILQEKIQDRFRDQATANQKRLCQTCVSWFGHCQHGLLPVTSKGEECPYFGRKQ